MYIHFILKKIERSMPTILEIENRIIVELNQLQKQLQSVHETNIRQEAIQTILTLLTSIDQAINLYKTNSETNPNLNNESNYQNMLLAYNQVAIYYSYITTNINKKNAKTPVHDFLSLSTNQEKKQFIKTFISNLFA